MKLGTAIVAVSQQSGSRGNGGSDSVHINTTSLPDATVGLSYDFTIDISVSGPDTATEVEFTWTGGSHASGLTLEPSNGQLHGICNEAGSGIMQVTCRALMGGNWYSDIAELPWQATGAWLSIDQQSPLTSGLIDLTYSNFTFTYSSSITSPTLVDWIVSNGALPPGMTFSNINGLGRLSGIPTELGSFTFTIQLTVADSNQTASTSKDFTLAIITPPLYNPPLILDPARPDLVIAGDDFYRAPSRNFQGVLVPINAATIDRDETRIASHGGTWATIPTLQLLGADLETPVPLLIWPTQGWVTAVDNNWSGSYIRQDSITTAYDVRAVIEHGGDGAMAMIMAACNIPNGSGAYIGLHTYRIEPGIIIWTGIICNGVTADILGTGTLPPWPANPLECRIQIRPTDTNPDHWTVSFFINSQLLADELNISSWNLADNQRSPLAHSVGVALKGTVSLTGLRQIWSTAELWAQFGGNTVIPNRSVATGQLPPAAYGTGTVVGPARQSWDGSRHGPVKFPLATTITMPVVTLDYTLKGSPDLLGYHPIVDVHDVDGQDGFKVALSRYGLLSKLCNAGNEVDMFMSFKAMPVEGERVMLRIARTDTTLIAFYSLDLGYTWQLISVETLGDSGPVAEPGMSLYVGWDIWEPFIDLYAIEVGQLNSIGAQGTLDVGTYERIEFGRPNPMLTEYLGGYWDPFVSSNSDIWRPGQSPMALSTSFRASVTSGDPGPIVGEKVPSIIFQPSERVVTYLPTDDQNEIILASVVQFGPFDSIDHDVHPLFWFSNDVSIGLCWIDGSSWQVGWQVTSTDGDHFDSGSSATNYMRPGWHIVIIRIQKDPNTNTAQINISVDEDAYGGTEESRDDREPHGVRRQTSPHYFPSIPWTPTGLFAVGDFPHTYGIETEVVWLEARSGLTDDISYPQLMERLKAHVPTRMTTHPELLWDAANDDSVVSGDDLYRGFAWEQFGQSIVGTVGPNIYGAHWRLVPTNWIDGTPTFSDEGNYGSPYLASGTTSTNTKPAIWLMGEGVSTGFFNSGGRPWLTTPYGVVTQINLSGAPNDAGYIVFRYQDPSNFWMAGVVNTDGMHAHIHIIKQHGNVWTDVYVGVDEEFPLGFSWPFRVEDDGEIRVYLTPSWSRSDTLVWSSIESDLLGNSQTGFGVGPTSDAGFVGAWTYALGNSSANATQLTILPDRSGNQDHYGSGIAPRPGGDLTNVPVHHQVPMLCWPPTMTEPAAHTPDNSTLNPTDFEAMIGFTVGDPNCNMVLAGKYGPTGWSISLTRVGLDVAIHTSSGWVSQSFSLSIGPDVRWWVKLHLRQGGGAMAVSVLMSRDGADWFRPYGNGPTSGFGTNFVPDDGAHDLVVGLPISGIVGTTTRRNRVFAFTMKDLSTGVIVASLDGMTEGLTTWNDPQGNTWTVNPAAIVEGSTSTAYWAFNGGNYIMPPGWFTLVSDPITVVLVVRITDPEATGTIWDDGFRDIGQLPGRVIHQHAGGFAIQYYTSEFPDPWGAPPDDGWHIVIARWTPYSQTSSSTWINEAAMRVDGVWTVQGVTMDVSVGSFPSLGGNSSVEHWLGNIAFYQLYKTALTDQQIMAIEDELAIRFGINL